ncbi:hypothetical protein TWF281_002604 [Arthrobotrys megalospora]
MLIQEPPKPTIHPLKDETFTAGYYTHGYPKVLQPQQDYELQVPNKAYRLPTESKSEFRKRKRDVETGIALVNDKTKFCIDPTNVIPGRNFTYIDNKYIDDIDCFGKTFNLQTGTGIPGLNNYPTPAQKYWRKRVDIGNVSVAPWRERECTDKRCDHRTACATNPVHVVMDRVPNREGMIPEVEIVPIAGQKRKREGKDDSPKKKRAVNA